MLTLKYSYNKEIIFVLKYYPSFLFLLLRFCIQWYLFTFIQRVLVKCLLCATLFLLVLWFPAVSPALWILPLLKWSVKPTQLGTSPFSECVQSSLCHHTLDRKCVSLMEGSSCLITHGFLTSGDEPWEGNTRKWPLHLLN